MNLHYTIIIRGTVSSKNLLMSCPLRDVVLINTRQARRSIQNLCNPVRASACSHFMNASRVFQQGKLFYERGRILNTYLEHFRDGIMCLLGDINTITR